MKLHMKGWAFVAAVALVVMVSTTASPSKRFKSGLSGGI